MQHQEASAPNAVVIEARDLCKSYGSGETRVAALRNVDLTISRGEIVAIMGPSGSGKSTLLSLIGAVDAPSSGKVLLEGVDLSTLDDTERTLIRRRSLGFVFQAFNLLPVLSALENVALPLELDGVPTSAARRRALAALEQVGMQQRHNHLPGMLSGGEQQRVAIARALVIQPAVLLADEPTGNLDSANGQRITELLRALVDEHQQTIVIVTHDVEVGAIAGRIIHMRDGRLEDGREEVTSARQVEFRHAEFANNDVSVYEGTRTLLRWRIAWREMRQHPGRALLTWLSVVIGVAAVLAVGLSTGAARRAYHEMYQTITGRATLELTGVGGSTIDASLLEVVRETAGVEAAVPLIQRHAIMYYGAGRMKLIALGIDPTRDAAVRDYELVAGTTLSTKGGVLLDASLAESLDVKVGDQIKLLVRRGLVRTTVAGLVRPRSGAGVASGGVLFMPLATAQRRFAAAGKLDRIQIVVADGADLAEVQSRLESRLPAGVELQPPTTRSSVAEETMLALENGLRLATAFSLLAAVFIIMNTFSMNIGQRRRQLAVMRAIGATRRQIGELVFREALLLGVVGTLAGIVAGLAGARLLNRTMSSLFQTTLPPVELKAWPLSIAAVFGLGVSLLGAWRPARRAARLTPLEGMSGIARVDSEGHSRREQIIGVAGLVLSLGLFVACVNGWIPFEFSVAVTVMLLISMVLLLPLALSPLTRLSQWLLEPMARIEARLARRQLLRHSARTSLTIGVLFVAVATGLGLANSVVDNVADVRQWYRKAMAGDFFIRATMPDMKTGLSATVPEAVGQEIQQVAGVTGIESIRLVTATANEQQVIVVAMRKEFPVGPVSTQLESNQPPSTGSQPAAPDSVTIGSVLAQRTGLKAHDFITLQARNGPQRLPITAVANVYLAGGLTVHMDRGLAERLLGVEGVDGYIVKADHAKLKEVEQALRGVCTRHGVLLHSYADLTRMIEGMMAGVVGSLWGLLVLGLVVAAFGVVNTLGMNVLEQTRELGLLRVVAMTPGQVRKLIVAQAAMLGVLGVTPGLLAGAAMAYIMNLSTLPVTGHPVAFRLHPLLLLSVFLVAMAMVLLASSIPAARAARLEPATALRYE